METKRSLRRSVPMRMALIFSMLCLTGLLFGAQAYACENPECVNYDGAGKTRAKSTDCIECLYSSWDDELKEYTMEVCEEYDVPYSMVNAIIWNESRYQADAVGENENGTQDWGLMQLNDVTFDFLSNEVGIDSMDELLNPKTNILAGVVLLDYNRQWAEDDAEMLMCYQMGAGAFSRHKKNGGGITSRASHVLAQGEYFEENCIEAEETPASPAKPRFRIISNKDEPAPGRLILLQA